MDHRLVVSVLLVKDPAQEFLRLPMLAEQAKAVRHTALHGRCLCSHLGVYLPFAGTGNEQGEDPPGQFRFGVLQHVGTGFEQQLMDFWPSSELFPHEPGQFGFASHSSSEP